MGGEEAQHALFLQVAFRKRALNSVALLQKETKNFRHRGVHNTEW